MQLQLLIYLAVAEVHLFFLQQGYKVAYNEYNIGYYALLLFLKLHRQKCIKNNVPLTLPNEWFYFVNREQYFNIYKQNNNNLTLEQLAYKYFVLSAYTFNNLQNKAGYLYGKDFCLINEYLHKVLINKDKKALQVVKDYFSDLKGIQNILDCMLQENIVSAIYDTNRAIDLLQVLQKAKQQQPSISNVISYIAQQIKNDNLFIQKMTQKQLTKLLLLNKVIASKRIMRYAYYEFYKSGVGIEHISRIRHIQAILQLPIENIDLYNLDYSKFPFEKYSNFVIYADPPYFNTEGYNNDFFDFSKFSSWCYHCKYSLFVSEITNPNPNKLKSIMQHLIKDNVSCKKNRKEQLFYNFITNEKQ